MDVLGMVGQRAGGRGGACTNGAALLCNIARVGHDFWVSQQLCHAVLCCAHKSADPDIQIDSVVLPDGEEHKNMDVLGMVGTQHVMHLH
jgi:hypothetical protein